MGAEIIHQRPASESVQKLIGKLRNGHGWLSKQHEYWLTRSTVAVDDEIFSSQLAAWGEHERILRGTGFIGCIWQPVGRCPTNAPVKCMGCVPEQPQLW